MPNDARPAHATLPIPVVLDGVWYPHIRAAACAARLTYNRLYEACRRGRSSLDGHSIAAPPLKYRIVVSSGDEADLAPYHEAPRRPRVHKSGDPLLRYPPGEGPLYQGLRHWR
jgi:hypothetical protein